MNQAVLYARVSSKDQEQEGFSIPAQLKLLREYAQRKDKLHDGTHAPLVSHDLFQQVQEVFQGHNKPRYRTHDFPYRGLLTCAYDNCKVTAEIKKGKYTYYRCTQFRGKCELPYMREEELGDRLGRILRDIHIPDNILAQLQESLLSDKSREEEIRVHRSAS
jgi:site-specific DNA recombinase